MTILDGRTWTEVLSPRQCWELLESQRIGRIGILEDSAPEIYPVNYVVDSKTILFRTDPGTKLHGFRRSPSVCFQIDAFDGEARTGWSVLVKGRASELTGAADLRRVAELELEVWALGDKAHWVRVSPVEVTGRRLHPTRPGAAGSRHERSTGTKNLSEAPRRGDRR